MKWFLCCQLLMRGKLSITDNIDFLYGLVLRTDGVVDSECCDDELIAKKRLCKASSMQQSHVKEMNVRVSDTDFLHEPNLCLQSIDKQSQSSEPFKSTIPDTVQMDQESFRAEDINSTYK
jgi:hypothetical protein